jgi:hypothetical protein
MTSELWTHIEMFLGIVVPLGLGIVKIIRSQARIELKVETMWLWYTNHGSNITGYKKEDK